jgi:hypothetical protein
METPTPGFESQSQAAEPKSNRTMIIIVVVLLLLCCCCSVCGGLGYLLWTNGDEWFGVGSLLRALAAV